MSASLRWLADGIEAAERAGGLTLECYHRPGFVAVAGVRIRAHGDVGAVASEPLAAGADDEDGEDARR